MEIYATGFTQATAEHDVDRRRVTPALPAPGDQDACEVALSELGEDARALRRVVDEATATPVYIDYRLGPEWFEGVADALDEIDQHRNRGPVVAMLVSEYMLQRLEHAHLDDSDGRLTQAFPQLERLHAAASEAAGIDPVALAQRLKALAAASEMEAFYQALDTHREALGERGLAELMKP